MVEDLMLVNLNLSYIFYNCVSLETLPDISKWNTIKVTNLSFMF